MAKRLATVGVGEICEIVNIEDDIIKSLLILGAFVVSISSVQLDDAVSVFCIMG